MSTMKFQRVLPVTLAHEGGFVNHPRDPGGATNHGITRLTLAEHRGRPVTVADVRALTVSEAAEIYRLRYWNPIRGDALFAGVDLVTFDAAVNSGVSRGARWTQAAAGATPDGRIGPLTLTAISLKGAAAVIKRATDLRLSFVQGLRTWDVFGRGWSRRIGDVRAKALVMAGQSADDLRADAEALQSKAAKDRVAGGGAAAGSGGSAVVSPDDPSIFFFVVLALLLAAGAVYLFTRARAEASAAEAVEAVAEEMNR